MRLIDADDILGRAIEEKKFVWQAYDLPREEIVIKTVYTDLFEFLEEQPTAYSVEAVVRELEEQRDAGIDEWMEFCFIKAIEIVKRGGRNE